MAVFVASPGCPHGIQVGTKHQARSTTVLRVGHSIIHQKHRCLALRFKPDCFLAESHPASGPSKRIGAVRAPNGVTDPLFFAQAEPAIPDDGKA